MRAKPLKSGKNSSPSTQPPIGSPSHRLRRNSRGSRLTSPDKTSLASIDRQIELGQQTLTLRQADPPRKAELLGNRSGSRAEAENAEIAVTGARVQLEQLKQKRAAQPASGQSRPGPRSIPALHTGQGQSGAGPARPGPDGASRAHRGRGDAGRQHPDGALPRCRNGGVQHRRPATSPGSTPTRRKPTSPR